MPTQPLCALHFPDDPGAVDLGDRLLDALAMADLHTVGPLSLWLGAPAMGDAGVLLSLSAPSLELAASWAEALGQRGQAAWWVVPAQEAARLEAEHPGALAALMGQGLVPCSGGWSGRALVGMSPAKLRDELERSHQTLADLLGRPPRALMPTPDRLGRAVDGLVEREARRAGYRVLLTPGALPSTRDEIEASGRLNVRWVEPDADRPEELRDWIMGRGLARQRSALRGVLGKPLRVLEALRGQED